MRRLNAARVFAGIAALSALVVLSLSPCPVRASDEGDPVVYARVIVETTALRTGPGAGFRIVRIAEQGESFEVRERATRGYWFRVQMPDGSLAWIDGNTVFNHELGPRSRGSRFMALLFAPPPLMAAHGELAVQLGTLSGSGLMALRPTWLLAPTFGFEANLAASVGSAGRLFMAGAGGVVNIFPTWPVVPFFAVGGGFARAAPNADSFILNEGTSSMLYAGGGLRMGFRYRLIVRVEARSYAFFDADRLVAQQEVSGGLSAFF